MANVFPNPAQYDDWKAWAGSLVYRLATYKMDPSDLKGGIVTSDKISAGAVLTVGLGTGSVTTVKLADSSVTTVKIGDTQVTTAKIGDASVTTTKLGDTSVTTAKIGDLAVTTGKMVDLAITSAKLGDAAVVASKIDALAVTTAKLDAEAVTAGKIAANAIVAGKIAAGTIVAGDIASHTVTALQIAAGTLTAAEISAGAITASKLLIAAPGAALNSDPYPSDLSAWQYPSHGYSLATFSLGAGPKALTTTTINDYIENLPLIPVDVNKVYRFHALYQSGPTTNGLVYLGVTCYNSVGVGISPLWSVSGLAASNTVRTAEGQIGFGTSLPFPAGTYYVVPALYGNYSATVGRLFYAQDIRVEEAVPATLIQDGAIITAKLAAGAVTAAKITALTITAAEIAAGTITAAKIAAGTITATELAANSITAAKITAGEVVAGKLSTDSVVTTNITAGAVTSGITQSVAGPFGPYASGAAHSVNSASYTATGLPVIVYIASTVVSDVNDFGTTYRFKIYRDGTLIYTSSYVAVGTTPVAVEYSLLSSGGAAGSRTWDLQWENGSSNNLTISATTLIVRDWLR